MACGTALIFALWCFVLVGTANCCNMTFVEAGGRIHCYNIVNEALTRRDAQAYCSNVFRGSVVTVTSPVENDVVFGLMESYGLRNIWLGNEEVFTSWRWLDGRETLRQGCFLDVASSREFVERNTLGNTSYATCEERCRQTRFSYGGLQDGTFCWCGNDFGQYGHSENGCNVLCTGDPGQVCGGETANTVLAVGGTYSNWLSGQPNNHLGYQTCAVAESTDDFEWLDVACSDRQAILCHIENTESCESLRDSNTTEWVNTTNATNNSSIANTTQEFGFHLTTASCLYVSLHYSTWFGAREICRGLGGDLMMIDSDHVTNTLVRRVNALGIHLESAGLWIGLQRSRWRWDTHEQAWYGNWADGRPNGANQPCAVMSYDGTWDDVQCDGPFNVVCETDTAIRYGSTSTTTQAPDAPTAQAPTTTKRRKKAHRTKPRIHESERGISDEHLASVVAGGIGMLIVTVIALTIYCLMARRDRKRRKEEKEDAKREKYFFGFDGNTGETTIERSRTRNAQENAHQSVSSKQNGNSMENCAIELTEQSGAHGRGVSDSDKNSVISSSELNEQRLSGKPDIIPD